MPSSSRTPAPFAAAAGPVPRHDRYSNGSLKASGFELDGALHGHWEWFRLDGTLMRSGEFHLGDQVGLWRTWDRAGRLVKETSFGPAPAPDKPDTADTAEEAGEADGAEVAEPTGSEQADSPAG